MQTAFRFGLAPLLAVSFAVAAPALKDPATSGNPIVGEWELVEATGFGGNPAGLHRLRLIFRADGRCFERVGDGRPARERTWKADPTAKPATLDRQYDGEEPDKEPVRAIYKVEGDTLTICGCGLTGGPRPTEFATPKGSKFALHVYKRVKPKD